MKCEYKKEEQEVELGFDWKISSKRRVGEEKKLRKLRDRELLKLVRELEAMS